MLIEKWVLAENLQLFGNHVRNFPAGVQQGFETLVAMLPEGLARSYYGVSWMETNKVIYYAMAAEQFPGESGVYASELQLRIEKGDYLTTAIRDWMVQTACIKDAFHEMMLDQRVASGAPCVEWYQSDEEMLCMMKAKM